ncbi:MAG TPA: methyltransferase [Chloroflexota bacterium]
MTLERSETTAKARAQEKPASQPGGPVGEPPAPDRLLELGLGFWGAKVLLSAVELGLFTELAKGPLDGEALRVRLGLHPRGARDFFDALVALGLLDRQGGQYANTPETDLFLDRDKPAYIGGFLEMVNARLYPFWGSLTDGLRTGLPQNEIKSGGDFFGVLYQDPARLRQFLRAMTGLSLGSARAIAKQFPWSRYRTFVDVGTAQGGLPVLLAQTHPHLTGGGFDLPPVEPVFADYVASFGLQDRLRFYPGDFFRDPLPRADVLVMGHILHDWSLDQKRLLLAKVYEALPAGGALIVYDAIIDDERRRNTFGLLMSLNMLVETPGGFDYTGAECCAWLREAGFREAYVEHLVGPESMVVGFK